MKVGSLVPFDIQVVNTLPDNYLWEKGKTSILVSAGGLYEVFFFEYKNILIFKKIIIIIIFLRFVVRSMRRKNLVSKFW